MSWKSAGFFGVSACTGFKKPTKIVKIKNSLSKKTRFLSNFLICNEFRHAPSAGGEIFQFELMRRMKVCESTSCMSSHLGRFALSYQGLISQVSTSLINGYFKFFHHDNSSWGLKKKSSVSVPFSKSVNWKRILYGMWLLKEILRDESLKKTLLKKKKRNFVPEMRKGGKVTGREYRK